MFLFQLACIFGIFFFPFTLKNSKYNPSLVMKKVYDILGNVLFPHGIFFKKSKAERSLGNLQIFTKNNF